MDSELIGGEVKEASISADSSGDCFGPRQIACPHSLFALYPVGLEEVLVTA